MFTRTQMSDASCSIHDINFQALLEEKNYYHLNNLIHQHDLESKCFQCALFNVQFIVISHFYVDICFDKFAQLIIYFIYAAA